MKLSLSKSIEARKLNNRTGLPESGTESTIPFGAIVEHISTDRDIAKFSYLGEHYRCAESLWKAAAHPVGEAAAGPTKGTTPAAEITDEAPGPRLVWEQVASTQYSVGRTKVPGGWLVTIGGTTLAFVPDPNHDWTGGNRNDHH